MRRVGSLATPSTSPAWAHATTPKVDHADRDDPAGRRSPLQRARLPAGHARARRHPAGDYAPVPWLQSSRGYAVWCRADANGVRFDLHRCAFVSIRPAGPLRLRFYTDVTPAKRLSRWLRDTDALPALLPDLGLRVLEEPRHLQPPVRRGRGLQRLPWHKIPLDAIVLDSPWETQYNTWIPNPHQFPDFEGMVKRFLRAGVKTVVWVVPWTNTDSAGGQIPPDPGSTRAPPRRPPPTTRRASGSGTTCAGADGDAFSTRWWMGTGSPVDLSSPAAETWWREQAKTVLRAGVAGIKTDDGEGYYFPDDVRFADGTTGAQTAWRMGLHYRRSMQRALDEVHGPGEGVIFGRCGWTGQQAVGASGRAIRRPTSGRSGCCWRRRSPRPIPASRTGRTTSAAISARSWSSAADPKELLLRWVAASAASRR